MSKSVLLSIQPRWCEKIASGRKTIEVRKTRPSVPTPFKCYIYCTVDGAGRNPKRYLWKKDKTGRLREIYWNGKVIGEFVCDEIQYADAFNFVVKEDGEKALEGSCIDKADLFEYLGWERGMPRAKCTPFYRWHISDLVIYNKPKDLSEFYMPGTLSNEDYLSTIYDGSGDPMRSSYASYLFTRQLRRPPQSWCYVEELT